MSQVIEMPGGSILMMLGSENGKTRTLHVDDIRYAKLDPSRAYVELEMYDEEGEEGGPTIIIRNIEIVTYKILASLAVDGAFKYEFLS